MTRSESPTPLRGEPTPHESLRRPWSRGDRPLPRAVVQPLQAFLSTEAAGGVVVLAAALAALGWANSPFSDSYDALWGTELTFDLGGFALREDLRHWVNDLLMALFFFVVGLEIKREFVHGALRDRQAAALPVLAALGGMVVPALVYLAVAGGSESGSGWGIPMATDIAFALGVLALLGNRAPASLKVFLLTLAVVDDIGAILVIAVFYSEGIAFDWLAVAAVALVAIVVAQRLQVRAFVVYLVAGAVTWLAVFESGVHATVAGVVLGLLTPAWPFQAPEAVAADAERHLEGVVARPADGRADEHEQATLIHVRDMVSESVSPLARLEHTLHPWTSFLVLPLFALANAGVRLDGDALSALVSQPVTLGIVLGLVVGKPLGIVGVALVAQTTGRVTALEGVGVRELAGVGLLAGIGFTVSIFIAGLAFPGSPEIAEAATVAILAASLLAGALGAGLLLSSGRRPT